MDRVLADRLTVWREQIDEAFFSAFVLEQIPELAPALRQHAGLVHLQTAAIAEALMERLAHGQIQEAMTILVALDQVFAAGKPATAIESALQVSFVTAAELMVTAAGRQSLAQAPERIRQMLTGTA
jgi:hypothetical protein